MVCERYASECAWLVTDSQVDTMRRADAGQEYLQGLGADRAVDLLSLE